MASTRQREELAKFLRARRAALTPELVRVPAGRRRRTPGLRREEVAQLADVGVTWYTWLEQGRDIRMSRETLDRIAHALRLTPSDRDYLFNLLTLTQKTLTRAVEGPVQSVLDTLESPAMVLNARYDVLAFNRLMDEMYNFDGYSGRFARNLVWQGFMEPTRRALYPDWEKDMAALVRSLRARYASHLGDANFEELIAALCESSPEFARVWFAQSIQPASLVYAFRLNVAGRGVLSFECTRFFLDERLGDLLVVFVPADARTAAILAKRRRLLRSGTRPRRSPSGARRN